MAHHHALRLRAPSRRRRFAAVERRARREWQAFRPSAILVAVFAGLALLDGLIAIGLFGLLEALGLNEPPIDPNALPAGATLGIDRIQTELSNVSSPGLDQARDGR